MSSGVNKVIIIGNLGKDPEVKYTQGGTAVCQLSVATTRTYMKQEQRVDETEWHRIVAWGKTAEHCGQYLTKGRQVYVEGRLQTRSWDDKDGVKRYTTEIIANTIQFLGGKPEGDSRQAQRPPAAAAPKQGKPGEDAWQGSYAPSEYDDEIPF